MFDVENKDSISTTGTIRDDLEQIGDKDIVLHIPIGDSLDYE